VNDESFADAVKYFRGVFRRVEKEDIDSFAKTYVDSEMEKEDLVNFYNQ
jgi:hypothetical protein